MELVMSDKLEYEADIIALPLKIKSLNVLNREHWAVKRRSKQEYQIFIRNQMRLKKISKCNHKQKFKLQIISYRKKLLDKDNLYGGCKGLIDALISEGFIFDDSPEYIDLTVEQHKAKEYQTVIVRK